MDGARAESKGSLEGARETPVPGIAGSPGRRERLAVAAILLLGAALRTVQYLSRNSMWFDELAVALNVERRSLSVMLTQPLEFLQIAPVGFLGAVKIASGPLGVTELGLRLVPWLSGLAALVLFWRVSIRFLAGLPLLAALLLFAVSPAQVWYGNNVKPYAGDVAVTLLLVLLALRLRERPGDERTALAGGLLGGATLFFSFPAVPTAAVLGGTLGWQWLRERPRGSLRPLLALAVPWAIAAVAAGAISFGLRSDETDAYMRRFWADDFTPAPWRGLQALMWIPERLFSILGFHLLFVGREWTFGTIYVAVCAALACLGLLERFRRDPRRAALLAAPTVAALLAATIHLLPFGLRVSVYAGWPLQLFALAGLQALEEAVPRRIRAAPRALTVLLAAVPALLVTAFHPPYHFQETRPVLAELARRWRPGDGLYVYPAAEHAADFYGRHLGLVGWVTGGCHREDPREYFRELDQFRGRGRVWFFYSHAALGFREPEVIRSYLTSIGEESEHIADPTGATGQAEAAAYLYDLSNPTRLGAATSESHRYPDPVTGGRRDLCDGTRASGR